MSIQLGSLQPGFMVLQGNRLEDLRDLLTEWIRLHPLHPLENECILVQSNGIAQWLKMALARDQANSGCGIAAALTVDLPGRFLWQTYRSVFAHLPHISPFDKAPLTWRIYRLLRDWSHLEARVRQLNEEPESLQPLALFLAQDQNPRRLHQLAAHLADLYDQYQVYRADWLDQWEANQDGQRADQYINAEGQLFDLTATDRWQALLWRVLRADIEMDATLDQLHPEPSPWSRASRASIHQAALKACADFSPTQRPPNLPRRVLVFGLSSLPRQTLLMLQALAPFTQILIFAHNPCQHYWGDLIEGKHLLKNLLQRDYQRLSQRKLDAQLSPEWLHIYGHPLLAAWGKQGRDYLHLLDEQDQPEQYRAHFHAVQKNIDLYRDPLNEGSSLLRQLQSDIFDLRALQERQQCQTTIDPQQDQSVQFFIAHSPQREIEILHDQLLAVFEQAWQAGDPLLPRDILVMVPDIHQYTASIEAVFGRYATQGAERDARYLPFHIADQSQRRQNSLLIAFEKLLQLPVLRCTVSEVFDWLDTPSIRKRYKIEEHRLPLLKSWIQGAHIRWGLNAAQRADLGLPASEQNTWLFGLRRLLLGFTNGGTLAWQGIEPHDEVAGLDAAVLGPLALLLDDLDSTRQILAQPALPEEWSLRIRQLLARFFSESSKSDTWAITELHDQLDQLETLWQYASLKAQPLALEVIREALLSAIDQPRLTQKFLGGSINFATLMPMRAIPFQQIWLLGMNDGDYPRSVRPLDFDLMAKDYRPGDRSRREDDRYLFLEALLSAREKLVISWLGWQIRDNSSRPPSVLVGQLRDHLAAGWRLAGCTADDPHAGQALLEALTTPHPLQAFSQDYFIDSPRADPRLITFAYEWQPLWQPEHTSASCALAAPLPAWQPEHPIHLNHLHHLLNSPIEALYRTRLRIDAYIPTILPPERESFVLDGLDIWHLKHHLIQHTFTAELDPHDYPEQLASTLMRWIGQGRLIEGALGEQQGQLLLPVLQPLFTNWQKYVADFIPFDGPCYANLSLPIHASTSAYLDVHLEVDKAQLFYNQSHSPVQVIVQASHLVQQRQSKNRNSYAWHNITRPWLKHLAAQIILHHPVTTHLLTPKGELTWPGLTEAKAQAELINLVQMWLQAMHRPLPAALYTGMAWLHQQAADQESHPTWHQSRLAEAFEMDQKKSTHLRRFYPQATHLYQHPDFATLNQALYTALFDAVMRSDIK